MKRMTSKAGFQRKSGARWARSGFTLIEVLMTVSILALMMAVAWGTYSSATTHQAKMRQINERLHGVEQAMNRMVREFSMAFITPHGQEDTQLEIRYKTGFYGEDDRVDFTSLAHVRMFRDDKVGDQSELSYYVDTIENDAGEDVKALVRREDAPIDDDPQEGGTIIPLLEDVKEFKLEYWDDAKAEVAAGADGWRDDWDTETGDTANRLPTRVRITIEVDNPTGGPGTRTFVTQAEIHLHKPLDF